MRRIVLGLLLAAACSKQSSAPQPPPAVPEPDDLLLVVSAASPRAVLERAAAYASAVSPGGGAALGESTLVRALATSVRASDLQGLDLAKPVHLLLLDPKVQSAPVVLIAAVADEAKLRATQGVAVRIQDGVAAIGAEAALAVAADHGFSLARRPAPAAPTLSLSPPKLVARYGAEIEKFRDQMQGVMAQQAPGMARVIDLEIDLFLRLADQTERLSLLVDATPTEAWFELAAAPRAGTLFAGFAAAQQPGVDAALLSRLPAVDRPSMVMVGRMDLGPARASFMELAVSVYEEVLGAKLDDARRARLDAMLDLFDGRIAAVSWAGAGGSFQMQEIFGVTDGARLAAEVRELVGGIATKPLDMMGIKMTFEARPQAAKHGDVDIDEFRARIDASGLPPMQQALMTRMYGPDGLLMRAAGAGKHYVLGMGADAVAALPAVLDAAGGGAATPVPARVSAAIDAAAGRKASFLAFMDLVQSMAPMLGKDLPASSSGLTMEMGVAGGAVHMRVAMPAAHVAELVKAMSGAL